MAKPTFTPPPLSSYQGGGDQSFTPPPLSSYQDDTPKTVGGGFSNALSSLGSNIGNYASGIANIFNPTEKNTLYQLGRLGLGAIEIPVGAAVNAITGEHATPTNEEQLARSVLGSYKDRYGSVGKIGDTIYKDPFGVLSDLSMLTGVGEAALPGRLGEISGIASKWTNPAILTKPVGLLARSGAEQLAEKSLGIRAADRLRGKTPGAGILDETGWSMGPTGVYNKAVEKTSQLTKQLEKLYSDATSQGVKQSIEPARNVVDSAVTYTKQGTNRPLLSELQSQADTLRKVPDSTYFGATEYPVGSYTSIATSSSHKNPQQRYFPIGKIPELEIAAMQSPSDILRTKRDFSAEHVDFKPGQTPGANQVAKQVYGALDQAGDLAVPEGAALNQRISSLIPVKIRGQMKAAGPGLLGEAAGQTMAGTGALASAGTVGGGNVPLGLLIKTALPASGVAIAKAMNAPGKLMDVNLGKLTKMKLGNGTTSQWAQAVLGNGTIGQKMAQQALISQLSKRGLLD